MVMVVGNGSSEHTEQKNSLISINVYIWWFKMYFTSLRSMTTAYLGAEIDM